MVKNCNFITIQGWMVTDLHLKGNDFMVYAIIYGFSQTDNQEFTGSLQYLADWTNSTKRGVSKNLENLIQKKLIQKEVVTINGVKYCKYKTVKQSSGVWNKVLQGMEQSSTNNIEDNIDNIINNISSKTTRSYGDEDLNKLLLEVNNLLSNYDIAVPVDRRCVYSCSRLLHYKKKEREFLSENYEENIKKFLDDYKRVRLDNGYVPYKWRTIYDNIKLWITNSGNFPLAKASSKKCWW